MIEVREAAYFIAECSSGCTFLDAGVAVMLAFIGQKLLVGHHRQFLTNHVAHRYLPLEILPPGGHQSSSSSGVSSIGTMRTP
jgi:hypothetical protein